MSRNVEKMLRDSFDASEIVVNKEKLSNVCVLVQEMVMENQKRERISIGQFSLRLLKFIGLKTWIIQGVILIIMSLLLLMLSGWPAKIDLENVSKILCMFGGTIPFVTFPIIYRSVRYGMQEVEMTTKYSYAIQLVMKFIIIGIGDLCMLATGLLLGVFALEMDFSKAILYGMVPFLVVSSILLFVVTHMSLRTGMATFTVLYVLTNVFLSRLAHMCPKIFEYSFNWICGLICVSLSFTIILQLRAILHRSGYNEMHVLAGSAN